MAKKTKNGHRTLASMESLSVPVVQEVVFSADFGCESCREKIAQIIEKLKGETQSLEISVVDKTVTLTCTIDDNLQEQGMNYSGSSCWYRGISRLLSYWRIRFRKFTT